MRIDVVVGMIAIFSVPHPIGQHGQFTERHITAIEELPILGRKSLSRSNFVINGGEI